MEDGASGQLILIKLSVFQHGADEMKKEKNAIINERNSAEYGKRESQSERPAVIEGQFK